MSSTSDYLTALSNLKPGETISARARPGSSGFDITTSTGTSGGSESPPDNGGFSNPPRDDTGSVNYQGSSSIELDPAVAADEPTFSEADPLYQAAENVESVTGGAISSTDVLDTILQAQGTFSTGVGGTTQGQDLTDFEAPPLSIPPVPEVLRPGAIAKNLGADSDGFPVRAALAGLAAVIIGAVVVGRD